MAETTQLSPAVARRCLLTLVKLGYVTKHKKQFLLRPDVMHFASAYLESMSLSETVRPHLQSVRDATGDSSSFSVLAGQDVLYLVHISTNRMVRLAVGVARAFPPMQHPWAARSWGLKPRRFRPPMAKPAALSL